MACVWMRWQPCPPHPPAWPCPTGSGHRCHLPQCEILVREEILPMLIFWHFLLELHQLDWPLWSCLLMLHLQLHDTRPCHRHRSLGIQAYHWSPEPEQHSLRRWSLCRCCSTGSSATSSWCQSTSVYSKLMTRSRAGGPGCRRGWGLLWGHRTLSVSVRLITCESPWPCRWTCIQCCLWSSNCRSPQPIPCSDQHALLSDGSERLEPKGGQWVLNWRCIGVCIPFTIYINL